MGEIRDFSEIKEKARRSKYVDIMVRATMMGLMETTEYVDSPAKKCQEVI